MMDFLEKFEKRMEWIGVVDSIVNRRGRDTKIEGMFKGNDLTNIIVSVLLFIMEKTLEENNECDTQHIEEFLEVLLIEYYQMKLNIIEIKELAGYIIKDILQNSGERRIYSVFNYSKNTIEEIPIRLIVDKMVVEKESRKLNYMLTNQGYDFLFRTREVDEEIQLTIEQLKLKEYVKRKKFSNAVRQSVELITYVRQKKKEVENFILSIRQNINDVDIDKYEQLLKGTYSMLEDEYETMSDIRRMIQQAGDKISEELESSHQMEDKLMKAIQEIREITHNLGVAISEQRNLILNRHNLSDLYMDTIKRSFEYSFVKRFNISESILEPLEKYDVVLDKCIHLLEPLLLPEINKMLSIDQIYNQQLIFKEFDVEDSHFINTEEYEDEIEKQRIESISNKHVKIVLLLFSEIIKHKQIKLSEIIQELKQGNPKEYIELSQGRLIFFIAFKLFDFENISIKDFYLEKNKVMMGVSESFNLERCLIEIEDQIEGIKNTQAIIISKVADEITEVIEFEENGMRIREEVSMTDLLFEVVG
ncbi:conserved protein of unknown function [Petrocella atlantisensis]|uniref:Replicative DNA helicase n=1 Tax=Petrocella atlantisensis TaxID=2173034 RepID=A0A3P7PAR0_9FIRM|nr:hypothetical protein [Petrocella atlantisensis]VDN47263.1 conserved protein of unknown function [Petrocella atlantisensis]